MSLKSVIKVLLIACLVVSIVLASISYFPDFWISLKAMTSNPWDHPEDALFLFLFHGAQGRFDLAAPYLGGELYDEFVSMIPEIELEYRTRNIKERLLGFKTEQIKTVEGSVDMVTIRSVLTAEASANGLKYDIHEQHNSVLLNTPDGWKIMYLEIVH